MNNKILASLKAGRDNRLWAAFFKRVTHKSVRFYYPQLPTIQNIVYYIYLNIVE